MAFVRLNKRHVTLCYSQLMDSGSRQIAEDGDWQRQRPRDATVSEFTATLDSSFTADLVDLKP